MRRSPLLLRRRVLHTLAVSVLAELLVDAGALAAAELIAPYTGEWVFIPAAVVVVATLPLLVLNLARVLAPKPARIRDTARHPTWYRFGPPGPSAVRPGRLLTVAIAAIGVPIHARSCTATCGAPGTATAYVRGSRGSRDAGQADAAAPTPYACTVSTMRSLRSTAFGCKR